MSVTLSGGRSAPGETRMSRRSLNCTRPGTLRRVLVRRRPTTSRGNGGDTPARAIHRSAGTVRVRRDGVPRQPRCMTRGSRITNGQNHGRRSRKSNWDCTICHSCRWTTFGHVGSRKRESRSQLAGLPGMVECPVGDRLASRCPRYMSSRKADLSGRDAPSTQVERLDGQDDGLARILGAARRELARPVDLPPRRRGATRSRHESLDSPCDPSVPRSMS